MPKTTTPILVTGVRVIAPYGLEVTFSDGAIRKVNLAALLQQLDGPVFGPLKDESFFARAFVDGYTVAWPNGADIAPEALYSDFETIG